MDSLKQLKNKSLNLNAQPFKYVQPLTLPENHEVEDPWRNDNTYNLLHFDKKN